MEKRQKTPTKFDKIFVLLFAGAAFAFFTWKIVQSLVEQNKLEKYGEVTRARVVSYKLARYNKNPPIHHYDVSFETEQGTVTGVIQKRQWLNVVNDSVDIVFYPKNPQNFDAYPLSIK